MAQCVVKERKSKRVCIGSLNKKITINTRAISPLTNNDVDYGEVFTLKKSAWAMVDTVSGETIFDSTNTERDVTHKFYVRFITGLTQEDWINFNDENFDVLSVEDWNEEHRFMVLRAAIRGSDAKPINKA